MPFERDIDNVTRTALADILANIVDVTVVSTDFIKENKLINMHCRLFHDEDANMEVLFNKQKQKRHAAILTLNAINECFSHAGLKYAVIKGMSFEKTIYGNTPLRDVGDIDILVRAQDTEKVHRILLDMGYKQQLGPSSGSMNASSKAFFVARITHQKRFVSTSPMKRFPFKDSYCPYIKDGQPTIELHEGFRGLPGWYTDGIVERAYENVCSFVLDTTDVLILMFANTYENAESFYSNYFDDKLFLSDFIDLACLLLLRKEDIHWSTAQETIDKLKLLEKAGRVLSDLEEIFPKSSETFLNEIPRLPSLWGLGIKERLASVEARRRAVLKIIRKDIVALASRSMIGMQVTDTLKANYEQDIVLSPSFELVEDRDDVVLVMHVPSMEFLESAAVAFNFFNIDGDEPPLYTRIIAKVEHDETCAFLQCEDRLPDGLLLWKKAGQQLRVKRVGERIELSIPDSEIHSFLRNNKVAVMACVYDKHYDDVYWTRCRGKSVLTGDVPVGFMSLFSDAMAKNIYIDFPFGRYVISSENTVLIDSLFNLFESSGIGMPIDCDDKTIRSAIVIDDEAGYRVNIEGRLEATGMDENQVLGIIMQDIMDWYVRETSKGVVLGHAASNLTDDGAILLMGASGSGKTTLSLLLTKMWPLRGDECACIDPNTATTWTYPLPVNLKANNAVASRLTNDATGVACQSCDDKMSYYYNRNIFKADSKPTTKRRIEAVVFPEYDEKYQGVRIDKVGEDGFAERVLQSLVGKKEPSINFRDFVSMIAKNNILLIRIRYSSAEEAASCLIDYLQ